MNLQQVFEAAKFRICGGSEYGWKCYGPNAQWVDFANASQKEYASCIYDTVTQEVYEVSVVTNETRDDYTQHIWRNPKYSAIHAKEEEDRCIPEPEHLEIIVISESDILGLLSTMSDESVSTEELKRAFPDSFPSDDISDLKEFTVVLNVKHRFTTLANSMEEAANIAEQWVNSIKPSTPWPANFCWEDRWVSKRKVIAK